jgi:hypothetical protein
MSPPGRLAADGEDVIDPLEVADQGRDAAAGGFEAYPGQPVADREPAAIGILAAPGAGDEELHF